MTDDANLGGRLENTFFSDEHPKVLLKENDQKEREEERRKFVAFAWYAFAVGVSNKIELDAIFDCYPDVTTGQQVVANLREEAKVNEVEYDNSMDI